MQPTGEGTCFSASKLFSLTLALSRWEREPLRTMLKSSRRPGLRPPPAEGTHCGRTPSFSQREKAGMREQGTGHPQ
mgnify:FL=1